MPLQCNIQCTKLKVTTLKRKIILKGQRKKLFHEKNKTRWAGYAVSTCGKNETHLKIDLINLMTEERSGSAFYWRQVQYVVHFMYVCCKCLKLSPQCSTAGDAACNNSCVFWQAK